MSRSSAVMTRIVTRTRTTLRMRPEKRSSRLCRCVQKVAVMPNVGERRSMVLVSIGSHRPCPQGGSSY